MPAVTNYFTAKRLFSFVVLSPGYFLDIYRNMAVTGEWLPPCKGLFHNKIYTAVKVLKPRLINHRFLTGKHLHTSNHSRRFYRVLGVCDIKFISVNGSARHCLHQLTVFMSGTWQLSAESVGMLSPLSCLIGLRGFALCDIRKCWKLATVWSYVMFYHKISTCFDNSGTTWVKILKTNWENKTNFK